MATTVASPARPANTRTPGWRLARGVRKAVLAVHILASGAWIGIDVVLGVLVLTAGLGSDPGAEAIAYQALGLFAVWPMLVAGLVCLASGVVLGVGSKYGLLRYWWVSVKLVLNVVLSLLVAFLLRPGIAEVAAYGRDLANGSPPGGTDLSFLYFPPAVSLTALVVATLLSVFKPFGRVRPTRRA